MSEENKDFSEKAEDAFDSAKEKASEKFDDVKEAANDFAEDAKAAFSPSNPDSGKTIAIVAHLTLIGWIIALLMNNSNKTEIGSFYIRQALGIGLIGLVVSWIPFVNFVGWIFVLILWIMSLIGAFSGEQKKVFLVGDYFQDWFKSL